MAEGADAAAQGARSATSPAARTSATTPSKLAANESFDSWNVTYDERGGVSSRLGYAKQRHPVRGGLVRNEFYSSLLGARVTQAGASLYQGHVNTARKTFTTAELVTFTETQQPGRRLPPDRRPLHKRRRDHLDRGRRPRRAERDVRRGLAEQAVRRPAPTGKLSWSAAGDPTAWAATDFNKLWEKDQRRSSPCTSGPARTSSAVAGLLAYKQESVYRVIRLLHGRLLHRRRDRRRRRPARDHRRRREGAVDRQARHLLVPRRPAGPRRRVRPVRAVVARPDEPRPARALGAGRKGNRASSPHACRLDSERHRDRVPPTRTGSPRAPTR
jgi:hypothetical protein